MIETLVTGFGQPLILWLSVFYIISEAISIYDTRLIQWKKLGDIPKDTPTPPPWTAFFGISGWLTIIVIFFLNWPYALALMLVVFLLKVMPIMETFGKIIISPFMRVK
ncbi:MAG: hypothetical protein JKX80_02050 [Candidatus Pacebacteria bacterium]|nr:hypothetical protein [Candidatus Paceibacterota bacterium]